ncbi:MAG: periplasmic heavy metal sensor [Desulfobacteraceae bacterium]|nr:periplasmic heavy metal sensor [Desulfobacteraceae bacterium]
MRAGFLKIALAVSLLFNLSALGAAGYFYAERHNCWVSPWGARMGKDKFLFEELALRPDQMQKMREKAIPFRALIDSRREEIAQKREHLFTLLRSDVPDVNAIKATVAEISGIRAEIEGMVATHILEFKNSLDKDQQKRFLDLLQNRTREGQSGCTPIGSN